MCVCVCVCEFLVLSFFPLHHAHSSISLLSPCLSHSSLITLSFPEFQQLSPATLTITVASYLVPASFSVLFLILSPPVLPPPPLKIDPTLLNVALKVLHSLPLISLPILTSPCSGQIRSLTGPQTHHVQATSIPWLTLFPTWRTLYVPQFPL